MGRPCRQCFVSTWRWYIVQTGESRRNRPRLERVHRDDANKKPRTSRGFLLAIWRRRPESNRRTRLCRPLHNHFATPPGVLHRIVAIREEPRVCRADKEKGKQGFPSGLERETRLELATSTLARLRSTN